MRRTVVLSLLALLSVNVLAFEPVAKADIADLPDFDHVSDGDVKNLKDKLKAKMDRMPPEDRKGEFKRLFDKIKKMDGKEESSRPRNLEKGRPSKREKPIRGFEKPIKGDEKRHPRKGAWGDALREKRGSRVLKVSGGEIDQAIETSELALVEFYAPWCGHCKKLAPEFDKASTMLESEGVALIAVDATLDENKALSSKLGVKGFPTLKVFKGGDMENPIDYTGPRTAEGISNFMRRMKGSKLPSLDASKEMAEPADSKVITVTNENFSTTIKSSDLVLLEFYAPWCGHCKKLAPEYSEASVSLAEKGIVLAKMDATVDAHKTMSRNFGSKGFPTLRIFKDRDVTKAYEFKGTRSSGGIIEYMIDVQTGTVELEAAQAGKGGFDKAGFDARKLGGAFSSAMKKLPGMEHLSDKDMETMRDSFKNVPKDLSPEERKSEFARIRKEYGVERPKIPKRL